MGTADAIKCCESYSREVIQNKGDAMKRRISLFLLVMGLLFTVGMSGVSQAADQPKGAVDSTKGAVSDTSITTAVKSKLAADMQLRSIVTIEVNTTHGVVTLAGEVNDPELKTLAEKITRTVDGVKEVKNNLQVKK
jgi:hyperosmotically inducible protein